MRENGKKAVFFGRGVYIYHYVGVSGGPRLKLSFRKHLLPVVALTAAVMMAGCPLPFEYNGPGTGTSHTTDPSSPNITAPVTVSYSVQGGPSGTVGDGGSFYAGQTMTVTLSTATVSALIFYTDDGTPLSLSSLGSVKKISASSGEITITRATSLQSLDIRAIAIGPNMLPSAAVHATVGVSPYPILSITRDKASVSEDGGTATFTITSSSAPASDITVHLSTSGDPAANYVTTGGTPFPSSFTATLLAGATTISLPITGQPDADGVNETVTLTIQPDPSNPPAYTVGAPASASVVIQDNRAPVLTLSGSPTSLVDGQISVFTVHASFAPDADHTVNISSSGYTAGKVSVPTSVTIPAGATSAQFQVVGPSEVGYEVQNPTVSLVPGIGHTIGSPGAVTLQIRDDTMGVFEYDGVWGFTTGTGSNVGTGASWNLTGNVTLGSGGLTFGGVYGSDDATVAVSNGSADFDKNRFTLAVKFTMADLSQARPIIAGGPATAG